MALEGGAVVLEKSVESGTSEIDKLPERMGMQRESDYLPDKWGTQRESDCLPDGLGTRQEVTGPSDAPETESSSSDASEEKQLEIQNEDLEKLEAMLSTPEGIQKLIEDHPEKAALFQSALKAVETLNDPDATDAERRSANGKLGDLKGQLLEMAVKDVLAKKGLSVENKQRTVEGQDGGTRPDVIAKNDTDQPISVFGVTVNPGETISIECKCGGKAYLGQQLHKHIPNQLSGQIGYKVLLTTGDIREVNNNLVQDTCKNYGATLVTLDLKVTDIEKAIKGVAVS